MENVPDFDIGHCGRRWSPDEIERKWLGHAEAPDKLELIDGKLFWSDEQRITMLGWMLEQLGADAAVRLGEPHIWCEAIEGLAGHQCGGGAGISHVDRHENLEALADEVRNVIEKAGWRDRNVYWPDGMQHVEQKLKDLDRQDGGDAT
ncbi:hypothetical protein BH23ACT11_BH23ACT11_16510 [soil metagenome]